MREKLVAQTVKLSAVSNMYVKDPTGFVNAFFGWLVAAEKDLSTIRSPLTILLQSEKASLISVMNGFLPTGIQPGKSTRKNQRAAAAQSLERISKEIYSKIESIDVNLEQLNEKLCHAVAVIATKVPGLIPGIHGGEIGADTVWRMLASNEETKPMYNYFAAKLSSTDREYLLSAIITNIASHAAIAKLTP